MKAVIRWFAGQPVAVNLIMLLVALAGSLSLWFMPREILPDTNTGVIVITVPFPGASAQEAEEGVCKRLDVELVGLEGVRDFQTLAREGVCIGTVRTENRYDVGKLTFDVRRRVESINGFPSNALKPSVVELTLRDLVATVVVSGVTDMRVLRDIAEQVRENLLRDTSITAVEVMNAEPYEIAINVPQDTLVQYGMSVGEIAAAVRTSSLDLPAGMMKEGGQSVAIVVRGAESSASQFGDVVLRAKPDGARLQMSDVAQVTEGFGQDGVRSEFNGRPAVVLGIYRGSGEDVIRIATEVKEKVAAAAAYVPKEIHVDLWQDIAKYLGQRLDTISWNALQGFCIVYLFLAIYMRRRYAFWTSVGIPFSFLVTFVVMYYLGLSLNMVTLFALLMVLGIVVDDAIVISESVDARNQRGEWGADAAVGGALDVALPVVLASLTTIITFAPLMFIPHAAGKLIAPIPIIIIIALLASLFEALFMLPHHLSYARPQDASISRGSRIFQQWTSKLRVQGFVAQSYGPFLRRILDYRYAVIVGFMMVLLVCVGMLASGYLPIRFLSQVDADTVTAELAFSEGTSADQTAEAVDILVTGARQVAEQAKLDLGEAQITDIFSQVGGKNGGHSGSVTVGLPVPEKRLLSGEELTKRWREAVGTIPDVENLSFNASLIPSVPDINIELYGENLDDLARASQRLADALAKVEGAYGVSAGHRRGQREVVLELRPVALDMGLTLANLADQVRQAFHGVEVQSFQRGLSEVKVGIRYPESERKSGWYLENMPISLPTGDAAPLSSVAVLKYDFGPSQIVRKKGGRVIEVTAFVDKSMATPGSVMTALQEEALPAVIKEFPSLGWRRGGVQEQAGSYISFILWAALFSTMINYALIAVLFRSYGQALLVMFAVPFGIIGALIGHFLMGVEITVWSAAGAVAVAGVVVNDNLVIIDYVNRQRAAGVELIEALLSAGQARFRAVLLTTATTFGGLATLMFSNDLQAQFLIPMAVSVAYGVAFSTLITLVLMPAAYLVLAETQEWITDFSKGRLLYRAPISVGGSPADEKAARR